MIINWSLDSVNAMNELFKMQGRKMSSGLKMTMKSSRRRSSGMDDEGGTASIAAILQSVGDDKNKASPRQK